MCCLGEDRVTNELHLFAGAGSGILASYLLGHRVVGAVEIDPYCQRVLSARMADGSMPWFPIYGDIREFDGRPYRGVVDCVSGGFARHVGAPHDRDRIWILAHTDNAGERVCAIDEQMAPARRPSPSDGRASANTQSERAREHGGAPTWHRNAHGCHRWPAEPDVSRVDDGVAHRVEWTRATGNGQVPQVAALVFRLLQQRQRTR